jgi:hypothetical protein
VVVTSTGKRACTRLSGWLGPASPRRDLVRHNLWSCALFDAMIAQQESIMRWISIHNSSLSILASRLALSISNGCQPSRAIALRLHQDHIAWSRIYLIAGESYQ